MSQRAGAKRNFSELKEEGDLEKGTKRSRTVRIGEGRTLAPVTPFEPISRRLRSGLKYLGGAWSKLAHEIKRLTGFDNGVNRTNSTEHFSDTEATVCHESGRGFPSCHEGVSSSPPTPPPPPPPASTSSATPTSNAFTSGSGAEGSRDQPSALQQHRLGSSTQLKKSATRDARKSLLRQVQSEQDNYLYQQRILQLSSLSCSTLSSPRSPESIGPSFLRSHERALLGSHYDTSCTPTRHPRPPSPPPVTSSTHARSLPRTWLAKDVKLQLVMQRSTGVQTSPEKTVVGTRSLTRVMEAEKSRQWLEELKMDHKHRTQYISANLELASRQYQQDAKKRMQAEDVIAERLKRELILMTLQDTSVDEICKELTAAQQKTLAIVLRSGPLDECLVEGFGLRISRADLQTLTGLTWLNDEIVNFYYNLVAARSATDGRIKVHVFNSFFYSKLIQAGYGGVRRWTKKVDIFAHDLVLLPIHLGAHWCCAAINFGKKQIQYYDSLRGSNAQCLNALRQYIVSESRDKKQQEYDLSGWTDYSPKNIPHQTNSSDCGVFSCLYARYLSRDIRFDFSQADMPAIRQHMICEIVEMKLF
ncbi:hypothetical protein EMCRGX_G013895 [Ephydatia muelleri]